MATDRHGLHRPEGAPLRSYAQARADTLRSSPAFTVIGRAIHERGEEQRLALAELLRRGLWPTPEQCEQAGLAPARGADHA